MVRCPRGRKPHIEGTAVVNHEGQRVLLGVNHVSLAPACDNQGSTGNQCDTSNGSQGGHPSRPKLRQGATWCLGVGDIDLNGLGRRARLHGDRNRSVVGEVPPWGLSLNNPVGRTTLGSEQASQVGNTRRVVGGERVHTINGDGAVQVLCIRLGGEHLELCTAKNLVLHACHVLEDVQGTPRGLCFHINSRAVDGDDRIVNEGTAADVTDGRGQVEHNRPTLDIFKGVKPVLGEHQGGFLTGGGDVVVDTFSKRHRVVLVVQNRHRLSGVVHARR